MQNSTSIVCTLYCVFTTSSQAFIHQHLSSLYPLPPSLPPFPLIITIWLSVSMFFVLFYLIPSQFYPSPQPSPLTVVTLFSVSMSPWSLMNKINKIERAIPWRNHSLNLNWDQEVYLWFIKNTFYTFLIMLTVELSAAFKLLCHDPRLLNT